MGRAASRLLAVLLPLMLALPLLEVAVRVAGLAPELRVLDVTGGEGTVYRRSENPILAFELKPNWRDPAADLVRSYPSTNAHGQRDVERAIAKPAGTQRVAVLGASVVEGVGLRDLEDTIPQRLERDLGAGWEALNFGVSAYCTRAKVELLEAKALAFAPDVIVLFVSQNDFRNFNYAAFAFGAPERRPAWADVAYRRSSAFRALATRLNWFEFRAQMDPEGWNRDAVGDNNVVDGLRRLGELARAHELRAVVAIWPHFTETGFEEPAAVPGESRLVFEALASANGLATFRFSEAFGAVWAADGRAGSPRERFTIGDRLHPNPAGAAVAAGALAELIRTQPLAVGEATEAAPAVVALAADLGRTAAAAPADTRRLVNAGNELLQAGRPEEALTRYDEALAADAGLAEAHHNRGVALRQLGRSEEALASFRAAAARAPGLVDAHRNVAVTLMQLGRPEEAVGPLERALRLRPDDPLTRRLRAQLEASRSR